MKQQHVLSWVSFVCCLVPLVVVGCGGDEETTESAPRGGEAVEAGTSGDDGGSTSRRPDRAGTTGGTAPGGGSEANDPLTGGADGRGGQTAGGRDAQAVGGAKLGGATACACPRALVCDAAGDCQEVDPCTDDQECRAGRICVDGTCQDGCSDNADCRLGSPELPICNDGRCVECLEDSQCPGNTTCSAATSACEESANCQESADCLPGRACLDGTCQGEPECPATPCFPDRICIESTGQCVPNTSGACVANENCVAPFVCVQVGNQSRCGRCSEDSQCGPSRTCERDGPGGVTRCTEPVVCDADEQCSPGRVCSNSRCGPPGECTDDMYDSADGSNNEKSNATPLSFASHDELVSCGLDHDWYRVELEAGFELDVEVRQSAPDGANYSLIVENEAGNVLVGSETDNQEEAVKVSAVDDRDRTLFIHVFQAGDVVNGAYRLDLRRSQALAGECSDGIEESVGSGDDSPELGRMIRNPGERCFADDGRDGVLCPGNDDYICFFGPERGQAPLGERTVIRVRIRFGGGVAVIGTVLNALGEPLPNAEGRWTSQDDSAEIIFPSAPGRHCLRLRGEPMGAQGGMSAASVDYTVEFSTRSNTIENLCEEGQVVVMMEQGSGVYVGGVAEIPLGRESVIHSVCGGTDATQGEKVFLVDVSPDAALPALLTATVGRPEGAANTLQDPMVSIRRDCTQACSEIACSTGQVDEDNPLIDRTTPTIARTVVRRPGTYAIIADGFDGNVQPSVSLDVRIEPAPVLNNDTCDDAIELDLAGGRTEVAVNLHRATDTFAGCSGSGSADAFYTITVDTPTMMTVRPRSNGQPGFAVSAFLADACADMSPMACGAGFEAMLDAGTYTLGVEGYGPNARGPALIDIWTAPLPEPPTNDTCATAQDLTLNGNGTLRGDTRRSTDDIQLLDFNQLTRRNTNGGDVVFSFSNLPAGKVFVEATPLDVEGVPVGDAGWDLSLYAFTDCSDPSGPNSRVRGSDGALTESIVFDGDDGNPIYVVVDGSNEEGGPFELRWGVVECEEDGDCGNDLRCERFACTPR
ncbi:MAG: hypothetical protein VX589_08515 [Myxococcota bacterium]|nr:hypothetical protein [Myxococcota bacterium]